MRKKNISVCILILSTVVIGVLAVVGLMKEENKSIIHTDTSDYIVGLSVHFMQDDYTINVTNAFEETMKENHVKTIITNANGDSKKQVADIEELVRRNVDAIGICPLDDSAIRQALNDAQRKGIKVVSITEISGVNADAVVFGREFDNGYGSGKRLVSALKDVENAEVGILDFPYDVERMKQRIEGFENALIGTDIKIASIGRCSSNEDAMDYVRGQLETNPNIKGFFCTYSNAVIGAGVACKALERQDVKVVGVDADVLVLKLIREGWVLAVTAQFPAEHGSYCAEAILGLLGINTGRTVYLSTYQIVDVGNATQIAQRLWGKKL